MRINLVPSNARKLHQEGPYSGVPDYCGKQASMQRVNLYTWQYMSTGESEFFLRRPGRSRVQSRAK